MKLLMIKVISFSFVLSCFAMSACGTDAELEIVGRWQSNYDALEDINESTWSSTLSGVTTTYAIVKFDNEANMAITQNSTDTLYDPGKYNKIVWTEIDDSIFYYCMVDYSKETAALAEASTESADSSDPEISGCGGFSWTKLILEIE